VHLLVRQRRLETIWERVVGQDQAKAPDEAPSLTLVDIAQELINGAFMEPYVKDPSVEEQQARVHFALKLDPGCADARPRHASFTYLGTHPGGCSPRLARAFSMCYNSSQRRQAAREARPCLRRNENGGSAPITFP
jgi:hypothetical protein